MLEQFGSDLGGLLANLLGRAKRESPRIVSAYQAAHVRATSGEGFGDEVLWDELKSHGVPGSHIEKRVGKRVAVAFAAWDKRVPAENFCDFLMRYSG